MPPCWPNACERSSAARRNWSKVASRDTKRSIHPRCWTKGWFHIKGTRPNESATWHTGKISRSRRQLAAYTKGLATFE